MNDKILGSYCNDKIAHTILGIRHEPYTQGATFDEKGEFKGRIDVTNHGRRDHANPHFHPATGPNSANTPAQPIDLF